MSLSFLCKTKICSLNYIILAHSYNLKYKHPHVYIITDVKRNYAYITQKIPKKKKRDNTLPTLDCRNEPQNPTICMLRGCLKNKQCGEKVLYYFLTLNSFNPNIENQLPKITNERFNYITNKLGDYNPNYTYNPDGYILILLINPKGLFKTSFKKELPALVAVREAVCKLIKTIRKYTNRKIVIRPKEMMSFPIDDETVVDNSKPIMDIINDIYCCFTTNSKMVLDFALYGIPLFNIDLYKAEYFEKIYINDISCIEKLNKIILPDRDAFLRWYYSFMYFPEELKTIEQYHEMIKRYYLTPNKLPVTKPSPDEEKRLIKTQKNQFDKELRLINKKNGTNLTRKDFKLKKQNP